MVLVKIILWSVMLVRTGTPKNEIKGRWPLFFFRRMVYLCLVYNFFSTLFSSFWWMMRSVQIALTASITQCDAFPRGVILHSFTLNFFFPLLPLSYLKPFLITSSKRERINTFFPSIFTFRSSFFFFQILHNGLEVFYPSSVLQVLCD